MADESMVKSATNWAALIAPLLTGLLIAVGVPIPGDALAPLIVSLGQSVVTLVARNRRKISSRTGWQWLAR
jgi:hypothetical protein